MPASDLQIDWLKCFVAAVDAGSLTGAGHEINRSPSAVSMQMKKLETTLGRQLLTRGQKRLELTVDGEVLLSYARRMLALHAETVAVFSGEELRGRIRLGVAEDYAAKYLTPVLKRYAPRYADVEIELSCEQSTALIPLVQSGDLDLALVSRDSKQRGTLLFEEPMVWVGSPSFELWKRDPVPIAVYEKESLARRNAVRSLTLQGRDFKVVYHSSSLAGQVAAVEGGLAIAAVTQCSVPDSLSVLTKEHGVGHIEPMQVAVIRSKASGGSMAVDSLHKFIIGALRQAR
ncbi:LysR family transcriptional regulator [Pseudomonas sp. NPDC089392]|uniref:LysR family transcriptional regulator n=1 Tax=Pseudomonas sp. NPDC089392 TaxID=3364459 RepID=UPI0037F4AF79